MKIPFQALKLLFTKPKLLALSLVPGLFTLASSLLLVFILWHYWLSTLAFWLAAPTSIIFFLVLWLIVGNLSLIPVEDAIIDFCQKETIGKIIYPAHNFRIKHMAREGFYSIALALFAVFVFLLGFFPLFTLVSFLLAALLTSYNFSRPILVRITENRAKQIAIYFESIASNLLLGVFLNFLLFVPILNVFLLGYAQILTTLLFLKNQGKLINK